MSNPRIQNIAAPKHAKQGMTDIVDHIIHCVNAAFILDDSVNDIDITSLETYPERVQHLATLIDMTGPLLAEMNDDDPLCAVMYTFCAMNAQITHDYVSQITFHAGMNDASNAGRVQTELDHALAVMSQVSFEIVGGHLTVIGWKPVHK